VHQRLLQVRVRRFEDRLHQQRVDLRLRLGGVGQRLLQDGNARRRAAAADQAGAEQVGRLAIASRGYAEAASFFEILGGDVKSGGATVERRLALRLQGLDGSQDKHGASQELWRRRLFLHVADDRLGLVQAAGVERRQRQFDSGRLDRFDREPPQVAPGREHQRHGRQGGHAGDGKS